MQLPPRTNQQGLIATAILLTGCAALGHYNGGITIPERVEECRVLDRKVTFFGSLSSIGSFLSGGTGLASALPTDKGSRVAVGVVSLVSGVFSAVTGYLSGRNVDRFAARNCSFVLNLNPSDTSVATAMAVQQRLAPPESLAVAGPNPELQRAIRQYLTDSLKAVLKFRKDSLKAVLRAREDSLRKAQAAAR